MSDDLIKVVEQYLAVCPKPVINAYMRHCKGVKTTGFCNCDGVISPDCVWDEDYDGPVSDCSHAQSGTKKHECEHWVDS